MGRQLPSLAPAEGAPSRTAPHASAPARPARTDSPPVPRQIVELISANAYVLVAIRGEGFCASAGRASSLMLANGLRMATLAVVGDAMLFLGKLGTAASSAFFTFVYLDKTYPDGTLSSPLIPVVVVFLTAFAIASVAFGVVEQAINATIMALCDDEDTNGGQAKWAPPALEDATGVASAHAAEMEAKKAAGAGCCSKPAADV
jgi:choline transporter-like protein 2/4/5